MIVDSFKEADSLVVKTCLGWIFWDSVNIVMCYTESRRLQKCFILLLIIEIGYTYSIIALLK